jgi:1,6-anhydro-N-acetylmuramate kinase
MNWKLIAKAGYQSATAAAAVKRSAIYAMASAASRIWDYIVSGGRARNSTLITMLAARLEPMGY